MKQKPKYMKRVFSGKSIPVMGLDQGKSPLYRGDGIQSMFNMTYDASMQIREGGIEEDTFTGGINTGVSLRISTLIADGTNIRAD